MPTFFLFCFFSLVLSHDWPDVLAMQQRQFKVLSSIFFFFLFLLRHCRNGHYSFQRHVSIAAFSSSLLEKRKNVELEEFLVKKKRTGGSELISGGKSIETLSIVSTFTFPLSCPFLVPVLKQRRLNRLLRTGYTYFIGTACHYIRGPNYLVLRAKYLIHSV